MAEKASGVTSLNQPYGRDAETQRDLSVSLNRIGDAYDIAGDIEGALRFYEESLPIVEQLAALDPKNAQWSQDLEITSFRLAELRAAQRSG